MPSLGRLGELALTAGVNAALPVYSKIASKVSRLSDSTAGKVVGSVLEKGQEFTAPVVGTVLKRFLGAHSDNGSHSDNGWGAPSTDVQTAAAEAVSPPSVAAAAGGTAPNAKSSAVPGAPTGKTTKTGRKPAGKTTAKPSRRPAGDPARRVVPEPTHKAESVAHVDMVTPGAPAEVDEMSLPIAGYSRLAANKISARLIGLTNSELALLFKFEKANKNRSTVIDAIDSQLSDLPMPTYDKMTSVAILDALNGLTRGELRTVREYEARTTNRLPILDRIDELLAIEV